MAALKRTLGVVSLIFYGVGIIVGAGIYSVIGAAAGKARESLWLAFLLAGVPAALAALSYAELSSMFRVAGGEFTYLRHAFPRRLWLGSLTGTIVVFAGAATAATVSLAFGGYFQRLMEVPIWVPAAILLVACTALNIAGITIASWANMVLTTIEVIGLLIIIGAGVRIEGWADPLTAAPHAGVFAGAALIFFVYTGFENIVNLSEEAKAPERDVPRALLISFAVTIVLYLLVALTVVALLEPERLAETDAPLAAAASTASPVLGTALGWIALFSTANTALVALIAASRLAFAMGRQKALPPALARTLTRRRTPWVAAITLGAIGLALLPLGGVAVVASVSSFASLSAFMAVAAAVIALRKRLPDRERGFRLRPSVSGVPIWPVLQIIAILALMTQFERAVYIAGGVALAVAVALYLARGLWGGKDQSLDPLGESRDEPPGGPAGGAMDGSSGDGSGGDAGAEDGPGGGGGAGAADKADDKEAPA
jgi:APA family basic amino acid/polyamine antiporter